MSNIIHTGRVIDESGVPLVGAHVITVEEPRRFTITDFDGKFTIDGVLHEAFEITFLGFESRLIRIERFSSDQTYILKEDAFALNEVTVTPRNPFNLGEFFSGLSNTVLNNLDVFGSNQSNNQAPLLPQNIVVNDNLNEPKKSFFRELLNNNPIATGAALVALIAAGAFIIKKK